MKTNRPGTMSGKEGDPTSEHRVTALAEGKMTGEEIEEIRKIVYGLEFTHCEFINAKLKVLGRS